MNIKLDHTIVWCHDSATSAHFLADILDLEVGRDEYFLQLKLGNGVTLDYYARDGDAVTSQHYAFLVDDDEFDAALERIHAAGVPYWADPFHQEPDRTNQLNGGRGVYFADPNGHNIEILTRSA